MKSDPRYLIYHDLIGYQVHVKPKNKTSDNNFKDYGEIIDETEKTVLTEKNSITKRFVKKDHIFRILLPEYEIHGKNYMLEVDGDKIVGLPENRLRSLKKKRRLRN